MSLFLKNIAFILLLNLLCISAFGQRDSCWTVLLLQKGKTLEMKQDMKSFCKTGFYLYRNCIYEIELKNKMRIGGRLVDIKPGVLIFTSYFNENVARKALSKNDTLKISFMELDKLRLIEDRAQGIYVKYQLGNFDFI